MDHSNTISRKISAQRVMLIYAIRQGKAYNPIGLDIKRIGLGKFIGRYGIINFPMPDCLMTDTEME
jgi:hypothetical protein